MFAQLITRLKNNIFNLIFRYKKGLEGETLVKWIIAIVILALCVMLIVLLKGKGNVIVEKVKGFFMFRR